MKTFAATLLAVSFLLALVFGAQTAEWSWGPAFVALALAVTASGFAGPEGGRAWVSLAMLPVAGWILYRGANSDVMDFARADALLLLAVMIPGVVVGALRGDPRALPVLFAVLAVASILNMAIGVVQGSSPGFTWPYHYRPSDRVTGFFGHPNYFACFTCGSGLLLAARGFFARDHPLLRFLFITTAVGSAVMVVVSLSRGGTIAMAAGVLMLVGGAGVLAWREGAGWAKAFLVVFPLLSIAAAAGGWMLFSKVALERAAPGAVGGTWRQLDNSSRLEWIDLALRVGREHPVSGGGSRAYSWERNRQWDFKDFGQGAENERFVHNEILQMFTDYGLVGVLGVILPIGVVGWLAVSRLFLGGSGEGSPDSLSIGVLSAGTAMLVQSNFSFVFHLLPTTLLFGLVLGLGGLLPAPKPVRPMGRAFRIAASALMGLLAGWIGIQGTRTLGSVWPVMYAETSRMDSDPEGGIADLEQAVRAWPGHRMLEEAGNYSRMAAAGSDDPARRNQWNRRAAGFYRKAIAGHRHHPGLQLNLANTLAELGDPRMAEQAYLRAIELQGGLEAAFRARFYYAQFLYELWYRRWTDPSDRRAGEALWSFQRVLGLLDESQAEANWRYEPRDELRRQVEQAIAFLEGARVTPQPPDAGVTE